MLHHVCTPETAHGKTRTAIEQGIYPQHRTHITTPRPTSEFYIQPHRLHRISQKTVDQTPSSRARHGLRYTLSIGGSCGGLLWKRADQQRLFTLRQASIDSSPARMARSTGSGNPMPAKTMAGSTSFALSTTSSWAQYVQDGADVRRSLPLRGNTTYHPEQHPE